METVQNVVALIPARSGSKSIPMKNVRPLGGRPLIHWGLAAALGCQGIGRVVVATDDDEIAETALSFNPGRVEIFRRSAETATGEAPTESVMLEFAGADAFDTLVTIQATSPLTRPDDLRAGLAAFAKPGVDSVVSVVRQKRFFWEPDGDGFVRPRNYDPAARPRRQEMTGDLVENGAFWICSRDGLLESGCRLHGNVQAVEMPEETYFEIDEPVDWTIAETLLAARRRDYVGVDFGRIRMLVCDVDGVLTNGRMYYSEGGDEMKGFNTRDGMGIQLLQESGVTVAFLTGESTELIQRRARKLNVDKVILGSKTKDADLKALVSESGLELAEVAYIGDDVNDLEALRLAGFSACPADAAPAVRQAVDYICARAGGGGCVRELAELIMAARDDA